MRTKILVLLLESYDIQYCKLKDYFPNLYRIGIPKPLIIDYGLPGISAKGFSAFYWGTKQPYVNTFEELWSKFNTRDKPLFWEELDNCKVGLLGLHITKDAINNLNGIAFTLENSTPYDRTPVIYPDKLRGILQDVNFRQLLAKRELLDRKGLQYVSLIQSFLNEHIDLCKRIISYVPKLDILIMMFSMDRFTHVLRGPPLLKKYKWMDSKVGEVLDMIEAKHIIGFSEHGANHRQEGIFVSNLDKSLAAKISSIYDIVPLIKEVWSL